MSPVNAQQGASGADGDAFGPADLQGLAQHVLDALMPSVVVLDQAGTIIAVNAAWRRFADENGLTWPDYGIGRPYLAGIDPHKIGPEHNTNEAARGIRSVMDGQRESYFVEYPCLTPTRQQWYAMWVTRCQPEGRPVLVISHDDITARKRAELALAAALEREAMRRTRAERGRHAAEGLRDVLTALNQNRALPEVLGLLVHEAHDLLAADAALIVAAARGRL